MSDMARQIISITRNLRRNAYALAHTGEAEAIGQATDRQTTYQLTADKLKAVEDGPSFTGGPLADRIQYAVNKLSNRIMQTLELAVLKDVTHQDMMDRLDRVLPKAKTMPKKKTLKKMEQIQEADDLPKKVPDMSQGYIDDETWDQIVDAYKSEYVPSWRGPKSVAEITDEETIYQWEVEKEMTHDFVVAVREGQIDAAKENGIQDYVWVAIVDKATDECCLWRDGLTTKEIEVELSTSRKDDDCQTIVPPAHFNCRCVLAPMVEEMPDRPESSEKEFEEWLTT